MIKYFFLTLIALKGLFLICEQIHFMNDNNQVIELYENDREKESNLEKESDHEEQLEIDEKVEIINEKFLFFHLAQQYKIPNVYFGDSNYQELYLEYNTPPPKF